MSCHLSSLPRSHDLPPAPPRPPGTPAVPSPAPRLVRFNAVAWLSPEDGSSGPRQSGLFVCGARPMWLVAARGTLLAHPMFIDGAIAALTPFHNVNCAHVRV